MTLTDEEALRICRMPKPTPGSIKKVIAWATQAPSPDKIIPLLLLQTGNHATRKGFDEAFHQALAACAQGDPLPLWEVVEGDWETYRVWHALRALAGMRTPAHIDRLVDLGRTPILDIHWEVIQEAAETTGVTIPQDVLKAQEAFEAQREDGDFYDHFAARKEQWEVVQDHRQAPAEEKPTQYRRRPKLAFPPVFLSDGEQNSFLQKYKRSLAKRWTLTRMEGLFEEVDLAFYVDALGRSDEALQIVAFLTDQVAFSGNYNIWTPVGYGLCLRARLHRLAGDTPAAASALQRLIEHPFHTQLPKAEVLEKIAAFPSELEEGFRDASTKWAALQLSRTLQAICYYRETGVAGFAHSGWYAVDELESLFVAGKQRLHERLKNA